MIQISKSKLSFKIGKWGRGIDLPKSLQSNPSIGKTLVNIQILI